MPTFAVKIDFEDKKFEKLANDDRKLDREFGKVRADKIRARLAQLRSADTLEDVQELMSGNICRCGAYSNINTAIMEVKSKLA